jgi:acyl carrier protein
MVAGRGSETMDDIEQSIMGHIRDVAAGSQVAVSKDTGLLDTGLLDSINLVGLIQFLEDHFSIKIPDSDIGADLFTSPATLIAYVEKRLGPANQRASA